jgi:hypothetical protein
VLWSRAQIHIADSRFLLAKRDLDLVERLFRSVNDKRGLVYADLGWGMYFRRKNDPRANIYLRRASKRAQALSLFFEATHADRLLHQTSSFERRYLKFGVVKKEFFKYRTLP